MPIAGLAPPSLGGSFQSGPQIGLPGSSRQQLVEAVMGLGAQPLTVPQQPPYDPGKQGDLGSGDDLRSLREGAESNDPWAVAGNRWHPDHVEDPMVTSPPPIRPLPAVNMASLQRAIATQPQPPQTGYRPGQNPDNPLPPMRPLGRPTTPPQSIADAAQRFFGGPIGGHMKSATLPRQRIFKRARFPGPR